MIYPIGTPVKINPGCLTMKCYIKNFPDNLSFDKVYTIEEHSEDCYHGHEQYLLVRGDHGSFIYLIGSNLIPAETDIDIEDLV